SLRGARLHPHADAADGDPAPMHQAHDAAVDESLRHPHGGYAAHLGGGAERGDDAHRRHPRRGKPQRAAGADVSLSAAVVLRVLLPDRALHRVARTPLPGALMAAWTPDQPLIRIRDV